MIKIILLLLVIFQFTNLKANTELKIEDSISVDYNFTRPAKQIVIKGVLTDKKIVKKWSLEKI